MAHPQSSSVVRALLEKHFVLSKEKNEKFSLRAYSKKLNISPSTLSEIINGKRPISLRMATRLMRSLNGGRSLEQATADLYKAEKTKSKSKRILLTPEQHRAISDWHTLAIRWLTETPDFRADPEWIGKRLQISSKQAEESLRILIQLGLLQRNEKTGQISRTPAQLKTTEDIPSEDIKKSHSTTLDLAKKSLHRHGVNQRFFGAMTAAVDPDRLPQAKIMVQEFCEFLTRFLSSENTTEVYRIAVQIFPLTEPKNNE